MKFALCEFINVALGKTHADLVIKDANIVNVNTREIYMADIIVKNERIVSVGDSSDSIGERTSVINAKCMYAIPGFVDAHLHVESSMITLTEFCRVVASHGTTSIMWDPHEIVNVAGTYALELAIEEAKELPLHIFFVVPSCVPSAPGKETSGASLTAIETLRALKLPRIIGLGEVMDFSGVLSCAPGIIKKLESARKMHKIIDGHGPGLRGRKLCGYIVSGVRSDHESLTEEEGVEKLRLGMWLMIRESSTSKDLERLIKPFANGTMDTKHCMFVSDDRSVNDLLVEGHMDHILRKAISKGMDSIAAIQMATINPATYMHVDNEIGSISPGCFADILLLNNLEKIEIGKVIVMGKEAQQPPISKMFKYPRRLTNTFKIGRALAPADFVFTSEEREGEADFRVIGFEEGTLFTSKEIRRLKIENGSIRSSSDVLYAAVVERHHGTGNMGKGFVCGLGFLRGAIGQSIAHDSHNLIVIGSSPLDMSTVAQMVADAQGGVALSSEGQPLALLRLEIGGLMSTKLANVVANEKGSLENEAKKLGLSIRSPITTLSFLSLPVIPELRLTDKGLFDVSENKFVDPIVR